jgi:hypothetical protein
MPSHRRTAGMASICGPTKRSSRVPVTDQLARPERVFYTGGTLRRASEYASVPRSLRSLHLKRSACHPPACTPPDETGDKIARHFSCDIPVCAGIQELPSLLVFGFHPSAEKGIFPRVNTHSRWRFL